MRIIAFKTLKVFFEKPEHAESEASLRAWYYYAKAAQWQSPQELKQQFWHASIIGNGRVVFNIKGNDYRLIAAIDFEFQVIYIRFVGTHKEYEKINPKTI
jgi:mRNA interferase HigB